jgi:hypothetical protein
VCSIDWTALRRVAEAIDRLEADRRNTDAADLEARVAAVWSMVSEIDPELARLASGYDRDRASRALLGHDVDVDGGADLGVQADADLV